MQLFISQSAGHLPTWLGNGVSFLRRAGHRFDGPGVSILIAAALLWLALISY